MTPGQSEGHLLPVETCCEHALSSLTFPGTVGDSSLPPDPQVGRLTWGLAVEGEQFPCAVTGLLLHLVVRSHLASLSPAPCGRAAFPSRCLLAVSPSRACALRTARGGSGWGLFWK